MNSLKIKQLTQNLRLAVKEYYLSLLCALILTLIAIKGIYFDSHFAQFRLGYTVGLGISLTFGSAMMGQRYGKKWLWNGLAILFLIGYYWWIFPNDEPFNETYIYILVSSYILTHLFVALAPFFKSPGREATFWQYNKSLFINTFLTVAFTLVLAGGLELAVWALDELFTLGISGDFYLHVFYISAIFGSTLIFCLFNAKGVSTLETETPYPNNLKFFNQFILIPLLIIYALILYAYTLDIIIKFSLPRGLISYLALAYASVGILALLLIYPLLADKSKVWVKGFKSLFYYSLIPVLGLLYLAILTRIRIYGITEARYFVLFLALWLSFITIYFILKKEPHLRTIPLSLFGAGLLILMTPYFNVFATSIRNQKHRFTRILEQNHLLKEGEIDFNSPVSYRAISQLNDIYSYLDSRDQSELIYDFMNDSSVAFLKESYHSHPFNDLFGKEYTFDGTTVATEAVAFDYLTLNGEENVYKVEGYAHIIPQMLNHKDYFVEGDTIIFENNYDSKEEDRYVLQINGEKKGLDQDLKDFASPYLKDTATSNIDVGEISIPFKLNRREGIIEIGSMSVFLKEDRSIDYITLGGFNLLLK